MKPRVKLLWVSLLCASAHAHAAAAGENPVRTLPACSDAAAGELGGDMALLRTFYTSAKATEGNHYVEMWKSDAVTREITRACGLTNNRALFVNSHGDAVPTLWGDRYGFRPHEARIADRERSPSYSVRDLFTLVGPAAAAHIHNICVSGCNNEGLLKAAEFRQFFPNATNITHAPAGESGYEPMFIQALTLPASAVRPLFETAQRKDSGQMAYSIGHSATPNAHRLPPYIAELFLPGAKQPYEMRIAGRNLLDSTPSTPKNMNTPP